MTNYIIEDDIDFYRELNTISEKKINDDLCLITNDKLTESCITLPCGHKFNYLPLFKEICKQKNGFNNLEISKLRYFQIKCPYCRKVVDNLLPYNPDVEGVTKIRYVNTPSKYSFYPNKCQYVFKSGKNKNKECGKNCISNYCNFHKKYMITGEDSNKEICTSILKSGKNKDKICGCKIYKSGLCKRHWNINNKNI